MWAKTMGWDLSYLNSVEQAHKVALTPKGRHINLLYLRMFAVHLAQGHTVYCKQVRAVTIRQYIAAVRSFLQHFTNWDFAKESPSAQSFMPSLQRVFDELERYDTKPVNRREPYTPEMHSLAVTRALMAKTANPTGKVVALTDWFECGLLAGFRLSEWAQDRKYTNPAEPQLHERINAPPALMLGDIRVETEDFKRATGADILRLPLHTIKKMFITFRVQKNGQDGEERLHARNTNKGGRCFVASMYRIITRFVALQCDPNITPLGVYRQAGGTTRLITSKEIEEYMQSLAAEVYQLDPTKDRKAIQKWGAHSLRVGACVLLHCLGFQPTDIKWLLRWRSDAFMTYLRNLMNLAERQLIALDRATAMPSLIS